MVAVLSFPAHLEPVGVFHHLRHFRRRHHHTLCALRRGAGGHFAHNGRRDFRLHDGLERVGWHSRQLAGRPASDARTCWPVFISSEDLAYVVLLAGLFAVERGITLPLAGSPGPASLWVFAALAGVSWIASVPVTTSLTADVYGLRTLATISGISLMCHQVGSFGSILLAGILYDATGSYFLPFAIAGALLFPAALSAFCD